MTDERFLTLVEVAERWNVSPQTVRRLAKRRVNPLPCVRLGSAIRFDPQDLVRFENERKEK